jgi:hypothetical protein
LKNETGLFRGRQETSADSRAIGLRQPEAPRGGPAAGPLWSAAPLDQLNGSGASLAANGQYTLARRGCRQVWSAHDLQSVTMMDHPIWAAAERGFAEAAVTLARA